MGPWHILASIPAGTVPATTQTTPAPTAPLPIPVPASIDWLPWLVVVIVWIFVAAAVIGPFIRRREAPRPGE